ncbi:hypothetical protein [Paraburkholderia caledonica]|uniref:Uncharacterized protein n=1 Tax=Paraburkholderia caledonica TaxID=134536 RepID=A0AB73IN79_9BURK|nr:hypothetical protein [Paraburkholderia caledonica]
MREFGALAMHGELAFSSAGYAIVENVWTPSLLRSINAELSGLIPVEEPSLGGVIEELDIKSDFFFDLARDKILLDLSEALLGMATIAIHIKLVRRRVLRAGDKWFRQNQYLHQEHFGHDALSFTFPLVGDDRTFINDYAIERHSRVVEHEPVDDSELGVGFQYAGPFIAAYVPTGGCIAHHSLLPYRPNIGSFSDYGDFLVINHRQSPYRAQLRSLE